MEIKIGQHYKMRDGRIALIMDMGEGFYPFLGRTENENLSWTKTGRYDIYEFESPRDLVSEFNEQETP